MIARIQPSCFGKSIKACFSATLPLQTYVTMLLPVPSGWQVLTSLDFLLSLSRISYIAPVICPLSKKPSDFVWSLYFLVHMRQINPSKLMSDYCFTSNPNIQHFFDLLDLSAIQDLVFQHKSSMMILGLTSVPCSEQSDSFLQVLASSVL